MLFVAAGLTFGIASLNSCTDACKDVVCQNGGTCVDGSCDCAAGYEGTNCETETRAKILGTFQVEENCTVTGPAQYNVTISSSSADVLNVIVTPFGGYTGASGTLKLDGSTLTLSGITGTTLLFTGFSGTVNASGSTITGVSYTVSDGTDTETCTGTWTKQ